MALTMAARVVTVSAFVPPFALLEDDGGDPSVHSTIREIELPIEPQDADVHIVFDSQGYVLVPRAVDWRTVKLEWDGENPRPHDLRRLLNNFLRMVGALGDDTTCSLGLAEALAVLQRLQDGG